LPFDLAPFSGVPAWAVLCVLAAHFIGFFIRGAFGFGSNMPIILLTTWLIGPHHAVVLVVITASAAQVHLLPQGFKSADWPVTRPLMVGMLAGITVGSWIFTILAADWLILVMGGLIGWIVLIDRLRLLDRLRGVIDLRARSVSFLLSLVSGLVGAISGGGGLYFLGVYLKLACKSAASLRCTSIILSGVFILLRLGLLILTGFVDWNVVAEAAFLMPVVLFGTWAGTRTFHAIDARRFYNALQFVLLAAAVALVARGVSLLI